MAGSPSTEAQNHNKEKGEKQEARSSTSSLRDFMTSTVGIIAGVATIATASATIFGILRHGAGQPSPTPSISAGQGAISTTPAVSPTHRISKTSPAVPRRQWGPGSLLLTNNGTSLSTVPPGNDQQIVGDVYVGGESIEPFAGTVLALWTSSGQPTAEQCEDLVITQGNPGQGVNVSPGSVVCATTGEGPIAIIYVVSLDIDATTIETRTTVWDSPGT